MSLFTKLHRLFVSDTEKWKPMNHLYVHSNYDGENLEEWLKNGIDGYKQWYQPVEFTKDIKASVTVPPSWKPNPELDYEWGLGRWNDIIKPNLPNTANARVLDLGCSSGLFSIELCKLGAKEVIGVDRDSSFTQKSSPLPMQDVISQASFVKQALEIINKTEYPVKFVPCDISNHDKLLSLGKFDYIMALNIVYHELEGMPKLIETLSSMSDILVLQASQGHGAAIGYWASIPKHVEILLNAGYSEIKVISPINYLDPMIIASKTNAAN